MEITMKLTIVAATGGVGRQLLEQAVAAGHDVAVQGADAVLSGLGPHSNSDAGIASQGTRAIVAAMQTAGVRRIVVVSAAPAGTAAADGP
jgi:putative NADH-flavin reductase